MDYLLLVIIGLILIPVCYFIYKSTKKEEEEKKEEEKKDEEKKEEEEDVLNTKTQVGIWMKTPSNQGECSAKCGDGTRIEEYKCYIQDEKGDYSIVAPSGDSQCNNAPKPNATIEKCNLGDCGEWKAGEWSSCVLDPTLSKYIKTRKYTCASLAGSTNFTGKCSPEIKKDDVEICTDNWAQGEWNATCSKVGGYDSAKARSWYCPSQPEGICGPKPEPEYKSCADWANSIYSADMSKLVPIPSTFTEWQGTLLSDVIIDKGKATLSADMTLPKDTLFGVYKSTKPTQTSLSNYEYDFKMFLQSTKTSTTLFSFVVYLDASGAKRVAVDSSSEISTTWNNVIKNFEITDSNLSFSIYSKSNIATRVTVSVVSALKTWQTGSWTACSSCSGSTGDSSQTRVPTCPTGAWCDPSSKPVTSQKCGVCIVKAVYGPNSWNVTEAIKQALNPDGTWLNPFWTIRSPGGGYNSYNQYFSNVYNGGNYMDPASGVKKLIITYFVNGIQKTKESTENAIIDALK